MPHIAVVCPRCRNRYQLDPGLLGKRMRCPNPICRTVFEVQEETPSATSSQPPPAMPVKAPAAGEPVSGNVTDFVPMLSAEMAEADSPPKAPRPPKIDVPLARPVAPRTTPPPIRVDAANLAPAARAPLEFPDDFPTDADAAPDLATALAPPPSGSGTWEAPPVRGAVAPPPTPAPAPSASRSDLLPAPKTRHVSLALIAVMLTIIVGGALTGWWLIENARTGSEHERFQKAEERYAQQDFAAAAELLQALFRDFPESADAKKYRFLAELSDVRQAAHAPGEEGEDRGQALKRIREFLGVYRNDPLLRDRHADFWQTLQHLTARLAKQAEQDHDSAALALAQAAWLEAKKFQAPTGVNVAELQHKVSGDFTRIAQGLAMHAERSAVVDTIKNHAEQATAAGVRESRGLAASAGLKDDPEVAKLLEELVKEHRAQIRYTPATADETPRTIVDDTLGSLVALPALAPSDGAPGPPGVVLSLANGVLYALEPAKGELRWARRVGADMHVPPVRVPPDSITPELVLVVSSDSKSVSALVADTGLLVWQAPLGEACLGRPVLVGRSLFVPTLAGRVEEIEISGGRRLGSYDLRHRLSVGGVRQEGTPLVYFLADDDCVYVLDTAQRTCAAILYSGHPAGSLRGLPIILSEAQTGVPGPGPSGAGAGWLFLAQAQGADAVEIRPYALPIQSADQKSAEPTVRIAGRASFAPWHDAEKLALATDAGFLSLWGIRQKGNRDPLLFPLLKADYLVAEARRQGRALVVHVDAENYWGLTGGVLHRLQNTFKSDTGPGLLPLWPQAPQVGSPLHAGQIRVDGSGKTALYLTTQALDRPTNLGSAIDADTGKILWQRQLGCMPLSPPAAASSQILLRDANGFFRFDAAKVPDVAASWRHAGERFATTGNRNNAPLLLAREREFVALSWPAAPSGPGKLLVERLPFDADKLDAKTFTLPAAPIGTPALDEDFALLPLANGIALRLDLKDGNFISGPEWRAVGVDEQTPGHIVPLGAGDYVLTDGSRGVHRIHWASAKVWEKLGSAQLAHRIVAAPVVLPGEAKKPRVLVADASDTLTLLDGERLQTLRRWAFAGKITSGPFLRGPHVGCILDKKRLVWLDPDQEQPAWEYAFDAEVVGMPLLVENVLVIADAAGQMRALDPATGGPRGPGYTFRANVAPASAPLPFGPDRLFVPLSDGTAMLVPLGALR